MIYKTKMKFWKYAKVVLPLVGCRASNDEEMILKGFSKSINMKSRSLLDWRKIKVTLIPPYFCPLDIGPFSQSCPKKKHNYAEFTESWWPLEWLSSTESPVVQMVFQECTSSDAVIAGSCQKTWIPLFRFSGRIKKLRSTVMIIQLKQFCNHYSLRCSALLACLEWTVCKKITTPLLVHSWKTICRCIHGQQVTR